MGRQKRGFTLVETVVTVGIVAALAAVVYPTVVRQFDAADPTRAAEDLNNIRTALETFGVNVKPQQPQEIEDLANLIVANSANDSTALGAVYSASDVANWKGPYIGLSLSATTLREDAVITTGFGALIHNRLPLFDADAADGGDTVATSSSTSADFVSVRVMGLSGAAFNSINLLIDGPNEDDATKRRQLGRLRCPEATPADNNACAVAYYLAVPLRH